MDQRTVRINDKIRAREVRVIDEDGGQLGIMPPQQALTIAQEKGLDLVEISATADPPVCKIMNSGKYFYQQAKRESEARKHQRHIQVKEVKFRVKIDDHDFNFKLRNVERFLLDGNKVKCSVIFRGREMAHSEIGRELMQRLAAGLTEVATIESPAKQEGNTITMVLSARKDLAKVKKPPEAAGRKKSPAEGEAAVGAENAEE